MCWFLNQKYLVTIVVFLWKFQPKVFEEAVGRKVEFVQDNHSKSCKGVLRGLHYQLEPYAQGKLVRCVAGEVFDVAVDIRKSSPTFGKWVGVNLSAENKRQLWILKGLHTDFWCWVIRLSLFIRRQIIIILKVTEALYGTMQTLISTGLIKKI